MLLTKFGVKNYKCLAEVEIALGPLHVLIGPNDAGKTSLLEALSAFFASGSRPVSEIFPEPWTGQELVFEARRSEPIKFWGEWELPDQVSDFEASRIAYGLAIRFPPEGHQCRIEDEWVEFKGVRDKLPFDVVNSAVYCSMRRASLPTAVQPHVQLLTKILRPVHMYSFNPRRMALPAALDPNRRFCMEPDGFGLPTLLQDILNAEPERFIALRNRFCELFPQFRSIRLETSHGISREARSAGFFCDVVVPAAIEIRLETRSGSLIRAQQASDGTILVLAFLALAHLPQQPPLLLIEEPENGIYPKRLEQVIQMLRELVRGNDGDKFPQLVFTTHSPFVVSFFRPEEVTFLSRDPRRPERGVVARPLRDAPRIYERLADGEFYLGELWYNLTEEELLGEPPAPVDY